MQRRDQPLDGLVAVQHLSGRSFSIGPLCFNFSQHGPTTRPSIDRTADKAFLRSDRIQPSSAEARVEGIVGGSVGVF